MAAAKSLSARRITIMTVKRTPNTWSLIDVFDRVLDKGIVIDAWVRMSLVGIDLVTVEARIVVASLAPYVTYADALPESKGERSDADDCIRRDGFAAVRPAPPPAGQALLGGLRNRSQ